MDTKKALVLLLLVTEYVTSFRLADEAKFQNFIARHGKQYKDDHEYYHRLQMFSDNLVEMEEHNSKCGKWKKGINEFSDLTTDEFNAIYGGGRLNIERPAASSSPQLFKSAAPHDIPKQKDWRSHGVITSVKNQGKCGSCWAHSATEQLESYLKLETNSPLVNLSVQQITSCSPSSLKCGGVGGCGGSVEQFAFTYAQFIGIVSEEDYPYISGNTENTELCIYNPQSRKPLAFVRGQETLPHNDYEAILHHIAHVGPLSISVAATGWKSYKGGIFDGCAYTENIDLNHGVQLVGYGTDEWKGDYWLVRNSWGASWGEDGYIRLKRESTVMCGVNETPIDGSGCPFDGIKSQKVCGMCGMLFEAAYPIGTERTREENPNISIDHL